jgi:hypothetical protein
MLRAIIKQMDSYIQAQRNNLDIGRQIPLFRELIGDADRAYRAVVDAHPENASPIFGQFILICHRSLLSAATLTAQSQPDDGAAITRRAVEVARTALAIKLNDQNAGQWLSFQERHERWLKRQQNERPRTFQVHFQSIKGEPLIDDLDDMLGVLSDSAVHFTPEYYITLDWEERWESSEKGTIFLNYFHRDPLRGHSLEDPRSVRPMPRRLGSLDADRLESCVRVHRDRAASEGRLRANVRD